MLMALVSLTAAASVLASGNAGDGRSITKSPLGHVTLYAATLLTTAGLDGIAVAQSPVVGDN